MGQKNKKKHKKSDKEGESLRSRPALLKTSQCFFLQSPLGVLPLKYIYFIKGKHLRDFLLKQFLCDCMYSYETMHLCLIVHT